MSTSDGLSNGYTGEAGTGAERGTALSSSTLSSPCPRVDFADSAGSFPAGWRQLMRRKLAQRKLKLSCGPHAAMSVLIETSLGPLTVDLLTEPGDAPSTSANFLRLCKAKKYNGCLFFNVEAGFVAQTGDPTGTGRGGTAFSGLVPAGSAAADGAAAPAGRFQADEIRPHLKHSKKGTVSFVRTLPGVPDTVGSQFVITLRDNVASLDGVNSVCGEVVDGMETLEAIGSAFVDGEGRPYVDIRILHTHVLLDPFPDPPQLEAVMPPGGASPLEGPPPEEVRLLRRWMSRCCCRCCSTWLLQKMLENLHFALV